MEFLESMSFPWDHCIVVLTHGDHAFLSMPEEERYRALKEAMANNELPKQLKKLINNSNDRALIVESSKTGDEKYYHSVMKKFLALISRIPGPYRNPHFLRFAQQVNKSRQAEYNTILQDSESLNALQDKPQVVGLFKSFQSAAKNVAVAQEEFIKYLHKIVDMHSKGYSPGVRAAAGIGTAACVASFAAFLFGVGLIPLTFGASTAVVTGGLVVVAGGVGATTIPPLVRTRQNSSEVQKAQEYFDHATMKMEELYQLYEEIMKKIPEDSLGRDHPEVHCTSLQFAHLVGVHIHGAKAKGDELCLTAEKLAVYHKLRKQAKEKYKEGSKSNSDLETSPSYALPIGFNLLARGFDVAYTVGAVVEVTQISKESKEVDTRMLKTTCIATLEKEMRTIKLLCKVPKQ
jgi:hypothetical protein